jgi:serine/threonine-protein kinase
VGLLPLALLSYQLVGDNRAALTTQVLRTHAVAARTAADRTAAFLEPLRGLADVIAGHEAISSDPRSAESKAILSGLLDGREPIAAVVLRSPEGLEYLRVQRRDLGPVVDAVLATPGPATLAAARASNGLWVKVGAPLAGGTGRVDVVANAGPLGGVVRAEEIGEEAVLALAEASGGLILASRADAKLESFPARLVATARSGAVSGAGRFQDPDGRELLGAWAPVPGSAWYVVSRQPVTVAEAVARRLRTRSLVAVGLSVVLTAVLSAAAYRSMVRPIHDLVLAQRRLLGHTAPLARGANEIDELRDSFRVLERRVRDQEVLGQVFLGRYQITGVLGEGGMGTVFRAFDPKLRRPVALKTIRLGGGPEDTRGLLVSQLLQEAITVARFSHPNIVAVYDVEDSSEAAFIAMEMVEGTTLARHLAPDRALPPAEAVPLCAAVARALETAHRHGVVHHDVKPGNVLLGKDGSVKVTDFGIAELVSSVNRQKDKNKDMVFGTPGYLPPECLLGQGYDQAGDVFALGAVMYRCLTGHPAIPGKDAMEIARNTLQGAVEMSRWEVPVPDELEALVMGLLTSKRELRTRSAAQVAELLESLAGRNGWRWTAERLAGDDKGVADASHHANLIPTLHLRGY